MRKILLATILLSGTVMGAQPTLRERVQTFREGVKERISGALDPALQRIKKTWRDPHVHTIAHVRKSTALPAAENAFRTTRGQTVQRSLEKALGEKIDPAHLPTIGLCLSGGGYRAMIAALGTLIGADDIGLLGSTMYTAGLSGSTWLLAPWIISGRTPLAYRTLLTRKVGKALHKIPLNVQAVGQVIGRRLITNQRIGPVDLYGALIANALLRDFGKEPQDFTLSRSHAKVASGRWAGRWPLPIYTAAWVEKPLQRSRRHLYEWMEFTPFEIGSTYLPGFIPTWALGRMYTRGTSSGPAAEPSLGFLLGIFGSAFAAQFKDIYEEVGEALDSRGLRFALKQAGKLPAIGAGRIFPARIPSFASTVPAALQMLKRGGDEMTLTDAGMIYNLPLQPLMRKERGVDIIVVSDASEEQFEKNALERAQEWARARGIAFPKGNYHAGKGKEITVCEDTDNPQAPIIIYLPLVKNEDYSKSYDPQKMLTAGGTYLSVTNFVYTPEQVLERSGLTEATIKKHKDTIYDVVRRVIERKRN